MYSPTNLAQQTSLSVKTHVNQQIGTALHVGSPHGSPVAEEGPENLA
jgi:hypothetical protein